MTENHARKNRLAQIKAVYRVKHADAITLIDHPDRAALLGLMAEYEGVNTYRDAVDLLAELRADPRNQVMCETCQWTYAMICPECPGCGCDNECSGWRHGEYSDADDDGGQDYPCECWAEDDDMCEC